MAKNKEEKTNVMRTLDQKKIPYTAHSYDPDGPIDGVSVAQILGQPAEQVFQDPGDKGRQRGILCVRHPCGGEPGPEKSG